MNEQLYNEKTRDKLTRIKILMNELTNGERLDIISDYCESCGSIDPACPCDQ